MVWRPLRASRGYRIESDGIGISPGNSSGRPRLPDALKAAVSALPVSDRTQASRLVAELELDGKAAAAWTAKERERVLAHLAEVEARVNSVRAVLRVLRAK